MENQGTDKVPVKLRRSAQEPPDATVLIVLRCFSFTTTNTSLLPGFKKAANFDAFCCITSSSSTQGFFSESLSSYPEAGTCSCANGHSPIKLPRHSCSENGAADVEKKERHSFVASLPHEVLPHLLLLIIASFARSEPQERGKAPFAPVSFIAGGPDVSERIHATLPD